MPATQPLPTKTENFANVLVTWGAFSLNGGLVSIKVSRSNDAVTIHVAADGTVTRSINNNKTGGIELVYGQNSTIHDLLSQQAFLDEQLGSAIYPIEVFDGNGRSIAKAPGAWIKKITDGEFQQEPSTRTWAFDCDQLQHFVGGLT